jgi:peptidoglycan hydrolase-like protein with peptidoglycan-binding domain
LRLLIVACAVALFATLGLAVQDSGVATRKTSVSSKNSTAKAHSAQKSSQAKAAQPKAGPVKSTQVHPVSTAKTTAKPVTQTATPPSKAAHRRTSNSSKKTATVVSRRSTQQQPTPERYKEIQQALADHGYFNGTVDGTWGADSLDALKRFQRDQNIADDGKLGSMSLIALGLGPKRVARLDSPPEKPVQ